MNKEEFQKNEAGVEVEDRPEITSPEQNKSSQEWANEILNKIEQEFDSVPDDKEEIEKIESSVLLENQSTKNEIKNELNLENNLNTLNSEAENTKEEAKSKISEITGLNKEAKSELSEFSKRYSAFYRDQIAQKINNLRFKYNTKLKEKPVEIESLNLAIAEEKKLIQETTEKKINDEELQKNIQEQRGKINSEIEELKADLDKRKNSFIYKIQKTFNNGNEITEELVKLFESEGLTKDSIKSKLYQKDFEIIQTIKNKKDNFENINASLEAKQNEINEHHKLLEKLKNSIEDKYKSINEAEEIINDDSEIKEIKQTIIDFYGEMANQKNIIESEKKERSVTEISKDKNVLFCHAIPMAMLPSGDVSFSQNNKLVDTHKIGPEEKLKMILGIEPTISVSTFSKENGRLAGDFGIILKGGDILAGYNKDAGSSLGSNIYDRKSKYDNSLNTSTIQNNIVSNIEHSINSKEKDGWNELVVENPKVAGLFYQINVDKIRNTFAAAGSSIFYAYKISKDFNLPMYVLDGKDKNKVYKLELNESTKKKMEYLSTRHNIGYYLDNSELLKIDETTIEKMRHMDRDHGLNDGIIIDILKLKEVEMDDILESGRDIPNNEKKDYIEEMVDKETFKDKRENIHNFNAYNDGKKNFILEGKNINSYIEKKEEELKNLTENIEKLKKEGKGFSLHRKKSSLFNLYGFMEECKKSGNIENYENAKKIIENFGNVDELERFVNKRIDENGDFKYLIEDAPIEIRKKFKELDNP